MNKNFFLIIAIFFIYRSDAQEINIPFGTNPTVDGAFSTGEWEDAGSVSLNPQPGWFVTAYYKHGDSSLFFCFNGLVRNAVVERYPDILLDINHSKSSVWESDDWWLHASYNDCEGNGVYNVWSSCIPDHPGWAANNFPLVSPGVVEIEIDYSKIGLSPNSEDTIGIALVVSNTSDDYDYYPIGATIGNPSTWTDGILGGANNHFPGVERKSGITIFPNPSISEVEIKLPNAGSDVFSLSVMNSLGELVMKTNNINTPEYTLYCHDFESGMYFIQVVSEKGFVSCGKFFLK